MLIRDVAFVKRDFRNVKRDLETTQEEGTGHV